MERTLSIYFASKPSGGETVGQAEILGEALPFEERIELGNWVHKRVDVETYSKFHQTSVLDFEARWEEAAKEFEWFKPWDKILAKGDHPFVNKWFPGGKLNLSYLALDRHVKSWRKNKLAIIWEGEPLDDKNYPKDRRKLTYYDLYKEV